MKLQRTKSHMALIIVVPVLKTKYIYIIINQCCKSRQLYHSSPDVYMLTPYYSYSRPKWTCPGGPILFGLCSSILSDLHHPFSNICCLHFADIIRYEAGIIMKFKHTTSSKVIRSVSSSLSSIRKQLSNTIAPPRNSNTQEIVVV